MKDLSIEEKAQRYDEAIERAKSIDVHEYGDIIEAVFPELKESENEKIRQFLIHEVTETSDKVMSYRNMDKEAVLTWLEKHDRQETGEWKEGNIIRHGSILALVIKGRRVMKSNGELFTVQYPNEWVKAAPTEIERYFNELEKQHKQEWSEKDKCMLNNVIDTLKPLSQTTHSGYAINSMINWLKSLRPQNWTKEDKERYISCLQRLSTGNPEQPETINSKWFKEHVYSQATWKPSEEQIKALNYYLKNDIDNDGVFGRQLVKLYHDLLILRKE